MVSPRSQAYKEAGVDIDSGNALVDRIRSLVTKTHIPGVISSIGGFGGLFKPDFTDMRDPLLVSSTDGVGTKLKFAIAFNKHDTIGIDLVAMSVNDILVQGARPLFFLDYFACGKLDVDIAATVVQGIADGCMQAGCALLGGETAEMPGVYEENEYDLAGFCVGIVDSAKLVEGIETRAGDVLIGLASSGLHANGYSLVRRLFEQSGLGADSLLPGTDILMKDILLTPTRIYVDCIKSIMRDLPIKGMVHVTGGGFYNNIPRVLPKTIMVNIDLQSWPVPPIFQWLRDTGGLSWDDMLQIFNCGIGYILIVSPDVVEDIMSRLSAMQEQAWVIGKVALRDTDTMEQVRFT